MPEKVIKKIELWIGKEGIIAFFSAVVIGLLTHLSIMTSDIPNHDGLEYMYTTFNNIVAGRWFIKLACGITSFYSLPWLISVLSLLYLGLACVLLIKLLKVKNPIIIAIISGMMVTFPSIASNFAYVFTMDGYMLGVLLAILAVYLVPKHKLGFLFGAFALAFSMGIYQAYLPITMLLVLYQVLMLVGSSEKVKHKATGIARYVGMGVIGVGLYYIILQICLKVLGTTLADYQGIDSMTETAGRGLVGTIKAIYSDFIVFSIKGHFLFANWYALVAVILLALSFAVAFIYRAVKRGWFKSIWTYLFLMVSAICTPIFANVIMLISSDLNYHSLMRYQWVMFGVLALAFIDDTIQNIKVGRFARILSWVAVITGAVIVFSYALSDNIAYSNLEKKYEKTYAYCIRLADRIEQTEGYYEGIPIYMIGVVGNDNFPVTDITGDVTSHMTSIGGDYLLYTPANYEFFYKYYLGITFNFLKTGEANYYYEKAYVDMPSFPYEGSTKVVNGVMYVKTENSRRD